ncbi:MAG TPA: hypothetical protein VEW93_06535 [Acidimicrobiales bacterium]|nr:hypothetical protein [Acidimicrobiales bacterium]
MLTFRRHRTDGPTRAPAWMLDDCCSEFRASGLELQLIEAVEARDRLQRGGVGDRDEVEAEIARLQDELARVSAAPFASHHVDAA